MRESKPFFKNRFRGNMLNMSHINKLAVFCGSSSGHPPVYAQAAEAIADALCNAQIGLVFGGGNVGLMGIIADRMLQQGGTATGVMPQSLVDVELAHTGLTEQHIVKTMHARTERSLRA